MEPVIAYGYIIADTDGRVQLHTLRSNRSECWAALIDIGAYDEKKRPEEIRRMKRMGFRCVPVWVKEAFQK